MPVYRFRTHEEAHRSRWMKPGDPRIGPTLSQVLYMGARLYPRARPAGVHKFRSIAEANAWRATWPRVPR
jgi:hypothetical protein